MKRVWSMIPMLTVAFCAIAAKEPEIRMLQRTSYVEAEALQAVAYSSASYCPPNMLRDWSCTMCRDGVAPVDAPNRLTGIEIVQDNDEVTQAVIGYDAGNDRIVVAFQGTQNSAQAAVDLQIQSIDAPEYCSDCRVHQGFYSAFTRVRTRLLTTIRNAATQRSTNDILFTGHSLGGAIATHAALQFALDNGNSFNIIGYTFGQPRTGNRAFSEFFDANVPDFFRVINYRDPVPTLIRLNANRYWHSPQEIWYPNEPNPGFPLPANSFRVLSNTNGEDNNGIRGECRWFRPCWNQRHHGTYFNLPTFADKDVIC